MAECPRDSGEIDGRVHGAGVIITQPHPVSAHLAGMNRRVVDDAAAGHGTIAAVVTPSEGLERLRTAVESGALRDLCQRYHVTLLTVFGSVGRGEPDPQDLDIGALTEYVADFDLFGFVTDITDLVGLKQVDVAHLNAAGPLLRERALIGSVILYEGEPGTWARASTAAAMERMDTDWLRQLSLDLLAG